MFAHSSFATRFAESSGCVAISSSGCLSDAGCSHDIGFAARKASSLHNLVPSANGCCFTLPVRVSGTQRLQPSHYSLSSFLDAKTQESVVRSDEGRDDVARSLANRGRRLRTRKSDLFPEEIAKASLTLLEQSLGPDAKMPGSLREAGAAVAKAGRQLQYWVHRRQALAKELPIYEKEVKICYDKAMRGEALKDDDNDNSVEEEPATDEAEHTGARNGPISLAGALGRNLDAEPPAPKTGESGTGEGGNGTSFEEEGAPSSEEQADPANDDKPVGKDPEEDAVDVVECKDFLPSPGLIVGRRAASEAYWQFDRALNNANLAVGRAMDDALARGA